MQLLEKTWRCKALFMHVILLLLLLLLTEPAPYSITAEPGLWLSADNTYKDDGMLLHIRCLFILAVHTCCLLWTLTCPQHDELCAAT